MRELTASLLQEIRRPGFAPRRAVELARALGLSRGQKRACEEALDWLDARGDIKRLPDGRYAPINLGFIEGRLDVTRQGYAFVDAGDASELDLRIEGEDFNGALPGDRVRAEVHSAGENARYLRGRVVSVVERARDRLVMLVQNPRQGPERRDNEAWLQPEDPRNPYRFRAVELPGENAPGAPAPLSVKPKSASSARRRANAATPSGAVAASAAAIIAAAKLPPAGTKVLAQIVVWPGQGRQPAAAVIDVLGPAGEPDTEVAAILAEYDAPGPFPEAVKDEVAAASRFLSDADRAERLDLTGLLACTIDPDDARDFDDALSIDLRDDGSLEVGVHIADVAHYVPPASATDVEARDRATSIYLPGRVIPMLPEELSNDACSLRPDEDRPVKTVLLRYDAAGKRLGYKIHRAVIRSRQRLSYRAVLALLDGSPHPEGQPDVKDELRESIRQLNDLAQKLRAARVEGGAIELARPEYRIVLDENGRAIGVEEEKTDISHQLVEEFMLAANVAVAEWAAANGLGVLHRVHPPPPPQAAETLAEFLNASGYPFKPPMQRKRLQAVLERARGRPEQDAINLAVLRSFSPAVYSPDATQGHFALNFRHYAHFTSPIRRYPDLHLHQTMDQSFAPGAHALAKKLRQPPVVDHRAIDELGRHTSERERRAMKIEGDVVDFRRLELLKRSGQSEWTATVTGIRRFGVFAQLDGCFVEGLLPRMSLARRGYEAREEAPPRAAGSGRRDVDAGGAAKRGGKKRDDRGRRRASAGSPGFYLGQRVRVRVLSVNLASRECELDFLGVD